VRSFSFMVVEHDPARPWIVTGVEEQTVELEDGEGLLRLGRRAVARGAV
jgi:hypothetical protein